MFIGIGPSTGKSSGYRRDKKQQFALFEIDVDIKISPDLVVANASTQSIFSDENEFNL